MKDNECFENRNISKITQLSFLKIHYRFIVFVRNIVKFAQFFSMLHFRGLKGYYLTPTVDRKR